MSTSRSVCFLLSLVLWGTVFHTAHTAPINETLFEFSAAWNAGSATET